MVKVYFKRKKKHQLHFNHVHNVLISRIQHNFIIFKQKIIVCGFGCANACVYLSVCVCTLFLFSFLHCKESFAFFFHFTIESFVIWCLKWAIGYSIDLFIFSFLIMKQLKSYFFLLLCLIIKQLNQFKIYWSYVKIVFYLWLMNTKSN